MNGEQKLQPQHLARRAVVYLRQSSPEQVKHNKESQQLQYALADRARALGFRKVDVIDSDLGMSAGTGAKTRAGFERLLAQVALNEVGLVMSRELSRLSRTDKDFCRLLELCQLFDTLIGDEQCLYNMSSLDDQLVLGIKGTLSVVELKVLRMRLEEGKRNKARRGELYGLLPVGYVLDGCAKPVKDPDARVREAIELVFEKFCELKTLRQTMLWFRDHRVELPANKPRGGKYQVVFQLPTLSIIRAVLENPFYAGAYVWGRRPMKAIWENGVVKKRQSAELPLSEVPIFLQEHHEGYISWATYEENLNIIAKNLMRDEPVASVGAVRAGQGLLAGLLRCGRCGRKVYVRYCGKSGTAAQYLCSGTFNAGGKYCISFGGKRADNQVSEEVLRALSPLGVRASVAAATELQRVDEVKEKALEQQVEQLDYEAQRAFEQYNEVDPRNRLVASELERRWNERLGLLENARLQLADTRSQHAVLTDEQNEELLSLGERFNEVWNSAACPVELKKKILRTVLEEVVVDEPSPERLTFVVHWKGGVHTSFELARLSRGGSQRTTEKDLDIIRKMAVRYGDDAIARVLNKLGRRTGKGLAWSEIGVKTARRNHGIDGRARTVDDPNVLTFNAAARYLDVSNTTIKRLVVAGVLPMSQQAPFAPWEIQRSALDAEPLRRLLAQMKKTGRLALPRVSSDSQQELFQENQGGDHAG
jgi:DNA invertase Pin-like site-specific DNA recombinase